MASLEREITVKVTVGEGIDNLTELVKLSFEQFSDEIRDIQNCIASCNFREAEIKLANLYGVVRQVIKAFENDTAGLPH